MRSSFLRAQSDKTNYSKKSGRVRFTRPATFAKSPNGSWRI